MNRLADSFHNHRNPNLGTVALGKRNAVTARAWFYLGSFSIF